jgi:hypothetical protein
MHGRHENFLKERDRSKELCRNEKLILKWMLEKQDGKVRKGFIWLRIGTSGGCCEYGNEPSGYIKGGGFLN